VGVHLSGAMRMRPLLCRRDDSGIPWTRKLRVCRAGLGRNHGDGHRRGTSVGDRSLPLKMLHRSVFRKPDLWRREYSSLHVFLILRGSVEDVEKLRSGYHIRTSGVNSLQDEVHV